MRKTRSFVAIVMTVLLTCLLATACGNGNVVATGGQEKGLVDTESINIEVEAQLAGVEVVDHTGEEIDNDALPDIDVDGGAVWTDSNPESVPEPEPEPEVLEPEPEPEVLEPEPETEPESVISESEPESEPEYQNPGTHGGYLHEIDGARFYTQHDINQWLIPNEKHPGHFNFDIYQMLVDIWCEDGGGIYPASDGFAYTNGVDFFTKGIGFKELDDKNSRLYRGVKFTYEGEEVSIVMRDCPGPYITETYSVLDGYSYLIHKEIAELILYAAEQMVSGSPYESLSSLNLGQNFSVTYY